MKNFFLIGLLTILYLSPLCGSSNIRPIAPEYVIMDEELQMTADVHMNANSVQVSILDVNGRVQCSLTTTAGSTVTLPINDASKTLRSIYFMDGGQSYIVPELIVIN